MDTVRSYVSCTVAALIAYFHPVENILIAVMSVLFANFLLGIISAKLVQHEKFDFKKGFMCFIEAFIFFALISFVFFVGDHIDKPEGALQCISAMTYVLIYFYGVNISKNLCRLMPENKVFKFIYWLISVEFINHIPYLRQFLKLDGVVIDDKDNKQIDNGNGTVN
jgi:hypothetical protein